jgi:hypothetical protein
MTDVHFSTPIDILSAWVGIGMGRVERWHKKPKHDSHQVGKT